MTSKGLLSSKLDVMVSVLRGSGIKKDYEFDIKDEVHLHTFPLTSNTTPPPHHEFRLVTPAATGGEWKVWDCDAGCEQEDEAAMRRQEIGQKGDGCQHACKVHCAARQPPPVPLSARCSDHDLCCADESESLTPPSLLQKHPVAFMLGPCRTR